MRNCDFLADDSSLVTTGGRDCLVFLWTFEGKAGAEGAVTGDKGPQYAGSSEDDIEVETVKMTDDEKLLHPDLKDLSK